MVSSIQFICNRRDFLQAQYQGEKAVTSSLVIQAFPRNNSCWRVGLTASKKIGNAVTRNRARRRMRSLVRQHLAPIACSGVDYVLIARHDIVSRDWPELVFGMQKAIRYLHHKLSKRPEVALP